MVNEALGRNKRFSHPFWVVTALSGSSSLAILVAALVSRQQTVQGHMTIGGLAAGVLFVHLLCWVLALTTRLVASALHLIVTVQIGSAIAGPLVATDYWTISLFVLLIVPLEVAIADEIRRISPIIIAALLGCAAMITVDLLLPESFTRGSFAAHPALHWTMAVVVVVNVAALVALLWFYRLRRSSPYRIRIDMGTQQSLIFTAISTLGIVAVSGVLIAQIHRSQIDQVGQNFQMLSQINVERVRSNLEQQVHILNDFWRRERVLRNGLQEANAEYPQDPDLVRQMIYERRRMWRNAPEQSDFVLRYRSNPQTNALNEFRKNNLQHTNLMLIDKYGALVAAQGEKPERFSFEQTTWWQATWNYGLGGTYLGNLVIDPLTRSATILMAVSITDIKTNQFIGALVSTYQLRGIQTMIASVTKDIHGEIFLFHASGMAIASTREELIGHVPWPQLFISGILNNRSNRRWADTKDRQGRQAIVAHSALTKASPEIIDPVGELNWYVVVSDTKEDALAQMVRSTKVAALVGLVVMAVGIGVVNIAARIITRPIIALAKTAVAITEGNLNQRAHPVGTVEMVLLSEAFNTQNDRLCALVNNLKDQVAERTLQLEARVRELQELNARLHDELDLAREIQQSLLLPRVMTLHHLHIVCAMQPARSIGGDFYSYRILDEGRIVVAVGDVSGKGVSAALLMAASLSLFDTLLSRRLPPGEIISELDHALLPYTRPRRQNCALCYVEFNNSSLAIVNAGCIPPYLLRADGTVESPEIGGLALGQGLEGRTKYDAISLPLYSRDLVILTSDGVVEATNEEGELLGFERLERIIASGPSSSAEAMLDHLRGAIAAFVGRNEPRDDITIVVIQVQDSCDFHSFRIDERH